MTPLITTFLSLACAAMAQQSLTDPTPVELRAEGGILTDLAPIGEEVVRLTTWVSTTRKLLSLEWDVRSPGARMASQSDRHTVSFWPNSASYSRRNPRAVHVVGHDAASRVVWETWTADEPEYLAGFDASLGELITLFEPPAVAKTSNGVDPTLGFVVASTTWDWWQEGESDSLLVLEHDSKMIYRIRGDGSPKNLMVDAALHEFLREQCSEILSLRHSIYGALLYAKQQNPLQHALGFPNDANDEFMAFYDQDLDGQFDGWWTITEDDLDTHPLFTTGEFLSN